MQKLARLLLVFLSIIFLRLEIRSNIIALFVAVLTHEPGEIFFRVFRPCIIKSCITFNSKSTKARVFSLAFLFLKPFFGLFLSFLRGFYIVRRIIYRLGFLVLFRLFNLCIFHSSTMSLYYRHSIISKTIALLSLMFHLLNVQNRQ